MAKVLMKGNEALGEAAIRAGCRHFFGYPITPQTEIPEYLSKRFPDVGGVYVQAESEVAASNMLYGAATAGIRVFTSSSSPGISLMAEGMSYIAGAELPVVLINVCRAGPGLGGILPSQGDYWQATRGLGHGDMRLLVLAPSSVQEAVDLMIEAFDLADKYRNPVMIFADGIIGQMMEPVEFKKEIRPEDLPEKPWALTGAKGRRPNIITSLFLDPKRLEELNVDLKKKYLEMEKNEVRYDEYNLDGDCDVMIVAFGTVARISKTAIDLLKEDGIKVGLFRPVSLYPFPYKALGEAAKKAARLISIELSTGQMIDDVRTAVNGRDVSFFGRQGGIVPAPEDIAEEVRKLVNGTDIGKGGGN